VQCEDGGEGREEEGRRQVQVARPVRPAATQGDQLRPPQVRGDIDRYRIYELKHNK
jgi:hypothetical protein